MNTMIIAAAAVAAVLGAGSVAYAGQGIPNLPAQPIVAQADTGVMGQSYPTFTGVPHQLVALRFAANTAGQDYPRFAPVTAVPAVGSTVEYAQLPANAKPRG
jgi:hypothetical protein